MEPERYVQPPCSGLLCQMTERSRPRGGGAPYIPRKDTRAYVILELFVKWRWRLTARLASLCGLKVFAFQAFNDEVTTYLRESRGYSPEVVGGVMTVPHVRLKVGAPLPSGSRCQQRVSLCT